ncbi:helix-turn-helix domain-containing protein [Nocardia abscessus]|uniref:helix-turn-helix domain-containing protein n=1 Tax=Nocardia abscessus TaxID=120957 RepID=UPI00245646FC|nr:helix-turn-helix transcriptional regulator [Nocardia abscessus]
MADHVRVRRMSRIQLLGFRPDRLLEEREKKGWSQGDLALRITAVLREQAGFDVDDDRGPKITTSAISTWERGRSTPTADNLAAAAGLLGVSMDYLVDVPEQERTLRTLRELSGRTQPTLAAQAGISSGLLASLERGHASLTDEVATRLAEQLDLPVENVRAAYLRGRRHRLAAPGATPGRSETHRPPH